MMQEKIYTCFSQVEQVNEIRTGTMRHFHVFPHSAEEVQKLMQFANQNHIPVVPKGAGTGLVGATDLLEESILLDMCRMNRVIEWDSETFTVTVEPGVLLKDLQQYVSDKGYMYPPDPGDKTATIGGNISTNAGGMRAVKYGVTRDYVMGLEVVTASGELLTLGSKCRKDSSGLDLKDLVIGSEGTLAVITKAILKVIAQPKESFSVIIPFPDLATGIDTVLKIIQENAEPTSIEFMERDIVSEAEAFLQLSFPVHAGDAFILLTFDGAKMEELKQRAQSVEAVCRAHGALDFVYLTNKEVLQTIWTIRGALVTALEANSELIPIDIVVPINQTAQLIQYTKVLEEKYGVRVRSFGHAGDGNVHSCVMRDDLSDAEWAAKSKAVLHDLYEKSHLLGGLPSGEHGIGIDKQPYFLQVTSPLKLAYMQKIKEVFDPNQILNPGKVYQIFAKR